MRTKVRAPLTAERIAQIGTSKSILGLTYRMVRPECRQQRAHLNQELTRRARRQQRSIVLMKRIFCCGAGNFSLGRKLGTLLVIALAGLAASANANILQYQANLDGPSESPPNGSPATGFTEVDYDNVNHTLLVEVVWSGLTGPTTASHIHAATAVAGTGTAGVATTTPYFSGFPIGVTSGSYTNLLDLTLSSSYNPSYVSANGGTPASAEVALTSAMFSGKAYLNIHSQTFGGGEIRGFLLLVPEPSSIALFVVGGGLVLFRKNRRSK
jgi:hypothetical protein